VFDVTPELIRSLSRASRIRWLAVKEEARELRGFPREKFRCLFLAMLGAKEWGQITSCSSLSLSRRVNMMRQFDNQMMESFTAIAAGPLPGLES